MDEKVLFILIRPLGSARADLRDRRASIRSGAQCVIGLAQILDFTDDESLARCIAAGYRPENVAPIGTPLD